MIYIELLLITIIVSLIYGTGFFEEMDKMISARWKFVHLPKIIMCQNCATWWICLLWILITGYFKFGAILFAISMWYVSPIFSKMMQMAVNAIDRVLDWMSEKLGI